MLSPEIQGAIHRLEANDSDLMSLDLRHRKLGSSGIESLSRALLVNSTLTSLDLGYAGMNISQDILALSQVLFVNSTLTALSLPGNDVDLPAMEVLARAIVANSTLTSLDLSCNALPGIAHTGSTPDPGLGNLATALAGLASLDLSGNQLGHARAGYLVDSLKRGTSLTRLNLGYNQLGLRGSDLVNIVALPRLEHLDLRCNSLGFREAKILAPALGWGCGLTTLVLTGNRLGSGGSGVLIQALHQNTSLTSLDLGSNEMGEEAGRILVEALGLKSLVSLIFSGNPLHTYPLPPHSISEALARNSTLTGLYLGSCFLGCSGAGVLAQALARNSTLTELSLPNNRIEASGAEALAEALVDNCSITSLNIMLNRIIPRKMWQMGKVTQRNYTNAKRRATLLWVLLVEKLFG